AECPKRVPTDIHTHHPGSPRARRAVADREAAGGRRLVPAWLHRERLMLHADARRCGRHRQAPPPRMPRGMDCERKLLLAKWTHAALAFALASFSLSRVHRRAAGQPFRLRAR